MLCATLGKMVAGVVLWCHDDILFSVVNRFWGGQRKTTSRRQINCWETNISASIRSSKQTFYKRLQFAQEYILKAGRHQHPLAGIHRGQTAMDFDAPQITSLSWNKKLESKGT